MVFSSDPGTEDPGAEEPEGVEGAPAGEEWMDALEADAPHRTPLEHLNGHARVDARPEVKLGKDLHRVLDETARALAADPRTFQRAYELVTVVGAPDPRELSDHERVRSPLPKGAPMIRPLNAHALAPRLSRYVSFVRYEPAPAKAIAAAQQTGQAPPAGQWREVMPPSNVVGPLLALGEWPDVNGLVGVTETPLFRANGTVHQERGYDPETGYLYVPSREYPDVDEAPSQADARAALAELQHVFCDFPYVAPAHAMVPIAAFLSVLARPAIDGPVPAFLFDASTRGSGKTLQADVVSLLATGRGAARATYPDKEEELTKALMAYALAGCPTVLLDNITRQLGGGVLDAVLTARDEVQFRVLGKNEAPRLPWRTVLFASGNNLDLGEDTMRRVLVARLESDMESPEDRTDFAHPDLFAWVRAERPRLVHAGLTVLRSYASHGRPDAGCKRWGTFEAWSALVPHAIVYAGGADPMLARPSRESMVSDDLVAHGVILRELHRLAPGGLTAKGIIQALYPAPRHDEPPDGWDDFREAIETWVPPVRGSAPDARTFGYRLKRAKKRVLDGWRLVAEGSTHGTVRWTSARV